MNFRHSRSVDSGASSETCWKTGSSPGLAREAHRLDEQGGSVDASELLQRGGEHDGPVTDSKALAWEGSTPKGRLPPLQLATVTLNGTLDRVILVPGFSPGEIRSVSDTVTLPSGKGLNVARTALSLDAELMTTGLVAGRCGQWICDLLSAEGISERFVYLPCGESRISTIIVDTENRETTVINDLGPSVPAELWPELCRKLGKAVAGYPWVALCGSSLPGLPSSVYADLCRLFQERGQRVCLDTRDQWLSSALTTLPYLVKCNQHEAADISACPVDSPEEARDVARQWVDLGIEHAVITMGSQGAVAVDAEQAWHVEAPEVDALCPIGSGDAMMAALIVALDRGAPLELAVQYGVALGAANTLIPGSGRCDLDSVPSLYAAAHIRPI